MNNSTPKFNLQAFNCPSCNAYAHQLWSRMCSVSTVHADVVGYMISKCSNCKQIGIWKEGPQKGVGILIWPRNSIAEIAHKEMPENVKTDFEEARQIVSLSPRGAAALLRLAIEKLCNHLTGLEDTINNNTKNLVEEGLSKKIQQALDIVRVTGNEAVHPGVMDIEDDIDTVTRLFKLINIIVENQISEPKEIEEMFGDLPQEKKDGIQVRDKKTDNSEQ